MMEMNSKKPLLTKHCFKILIMQIHQKVLFSDDECKKIIESQKTNNINWFSLDRKYTSYNLNYSKDNNWIYDRLINYFESIHGKKILSIITPIHFHVFNEKSFFSKHKDDKQDRIYSIGVLLNDNFIGGDFVIYGNDKNIILEKKVGNSYIFNSEFEHEVLELKKHERYSLIWFVYEKSFHDYKNSETLI